MRSLSKVLTLTLLFGALVNTARAAHQNAPRALKSVRQELWDFGLMENGEELDQDEKEILLGATQNQNELPEELQKAILHHN